MRRPVRDLELVHGVAPFRRTPVSEGYRYLRLHGRPAYDDRQRYADPELDELVGFVGPGAPNRVLFNNDGRLDDANRFRGRLAAQA